MDSKFFAAYSAGVGNPYSTVKGQFKTRLKLLSNICGGPKMGI
jgi:hypothetical protein